MEYIIVVLLFINILISLSYFYMSNKRNNNNNLELIKNIQASNDQSFQVFTKDILSTLQTQNNQLNEFKISLLNINNDNHIHTLKEINELKEKMVLDLNRSFKDVNVILESKLLEINKDLHTQMNRNFEKTNEAFSHMIERMTKIDEAQKKIESLSTNIVALQDILNDKKSRGAFGEVQLNNLLKSVFGEKNSKVYELQYTLKNGSVCDSILHLPDPVGDIAIDSKFPLESYRIMTSTDDQVAKNEAFKQFKRDLKVHIDAISSKYINEPETANSAILFLPAESIFAEINAYHYDIVEYANNKRVWLTSPTTLMATLTSIQVIIQNIEQSKYAKIIQEHLLKLKDEFIRYSSRWDALSKHLDTISKDAKDIHTTTKKINSQFTKISAVEFDEESGDLIE